MGETIRSLAEQYGVSVEDAIRALEQNDVLVLSEDIPIVSARKLEKIRQILANTGKPTAVVPPRPTPAPTPAPKQAAAPEPTPAVNPQPAKMPAPPEMDERQRAKERQKQLLSRDYVIFTHMALRKPITHVILRQVIELKSTRQTKTKIVVCSETMDYVTKVAETDTRLQETTASLALLKKYQALTILPGRISEENHSISSFIKTCKLSDSILIVGVNRSLSTFVYHRNRSNQSNPAYVKIFERDITTAAHLTNPRNQTVAFADPADKALCPYTDKPVSLSAEIPAVGQTVYCKRKEERIPLVLESEVGRGGEAFIYKVSSGTKCAKIFKADSNSELKMKKIAIMCSKYALLKSIDTPIMERIAWPEKMLFNEQDEPIGYMMNLFEGTTPFSEFSARSFPKLIPELKKEHQVTMAVNFAELIDFMHHNNILLCDINRGNVMFDQNQMAYLVDLDSAQIADEQYYYPSNVGIPEFLSPEHIYDENFSFKRQKADDVWILQMLLFHILTPDGNPYATAKPYTDDREPIAKGYYPYQSKEKQAEEEVKGTLWHMIVSHFPPFIKELFWNSLHGEGTFFHAAERRNAQIWLNAMVRYQECLPQLVKTDEESGKYKPTAYRKYIPAQEKSDTPGDSLEDLLKNCSPQKREPINWNDLN